jgi:gamma-glutamyltranspeptidase/glutathione hydrolase
VSKLDLRRLAAGAFNLGERRLKDPIGEGVMTKSNSPIAFLPAFIILSLTAAPRAGSSQEKDAAHELIAPFNSYVTVYDNHNVEPMRPDIFGTRGVVATGNYLATLAGIEVLRKGGNAFDAGVAAAMALKGTTFDIAGWSGVAPLILYSAREDRVLTRTGAGTAPAAATLENYRRHGKDPARSCIVPADVDVWLAALDRLGTRSFSEVAAYALDVAENGYHLHHRQKFSIDQALERIPRWPQNASFWLQNGKGRQRLGSLMVNKDLGKLIRYMMDAEQRVLAAGGSRSQAIQAARDAFYKGEPARAVDAFFREQVDGQMTYQDMAGYQGRWDAPLHTTYRGYDVYACDAWSQGPRFILMLNMLESFDLKALGYNSADYIHLISQIINLAMSDSHKYLGDPDFVEIPAALYSKQYARERIRLVDRNRAFQDMPPWGDPANLKNLHPSSPRSFLKTESGAAGAGGLDSRNVGDTTSLNVLDREGNLFSMTESNGHLTTPLIPGWGFGLGNRGGQINLDPNLANVVAPGKRPRNTNTPFLVMKEGKPLMGLSLAGGDMQAQALLQIFLNCRRVGHDAAAGHGSSAVWQREFPGNRRRVQREPRGAEFRSPHPERDGARPREARSPRPELGVVELRRRRWDDHLPRSADRFSHGAAANPRREMYALGY